MLHGNRTHTRALRIMRPRARNPTQAAHHGTPRIPLRVGLNRRSLGAARRVASTPVKITHPQQTFCPHRKVATNPAHPDVCSTSTESRASPQLEPFSMKIEAPTRVKRSLLRTRLVKTALTCMNRPRLLDTGTQKPVNYTDSTQFVTLKTGHARPCVHYQVEPCTSMQIQQRRYVQKSTLSSANRQRAVLEQRPGG